MPTDLSSEDPEVVVTGPLTAGKGMANASVIDVGAAGYLEEEYLYEGDAASFDLEGDEAADGRWRVVEADRAPFRTRLIVRRPTDPAAFSGVVLVEWLNVSSGRDGDPDWGYNFQEILREGHAYVGVSAQAAGTVGGATAVESPGGALPLITADPERYGSIVHPGDAYSFDMFTQAAVALTGAAGPTLLGELEPTAIIAMGESQSATFLTTYVNGVHPVAQVYDGFLLHSRLGPVPTLDGDRVTALGDRPFTTVRTDLTEPVMMFQTETDLTVLRYFGARQPDTDRIRTWEVAGAAHADAYLLTDVYNLGSSIDPAALLGCTAPLNTGMHHQTVKAALHHLVAWVVEGTPPPTSPRLEVLAPTEPDGLPVIQRDERGNARGGLRTPSVDVPIAALSGDPVPDSSPICSLFGSTTPFDAATLAELYPTKAAYLSAFTASTEAAVDAGFILRPEADAMITAAEQVTFA